MQEIEAKLEVRSTQELQAAIASELEAEEPENLEGAFARLLADGATE